MASPLSPVSGPLLRRPSSRLVAHVPGQSETSIEVIRHKSGGHAPQTPVLLASSCATNASVLKAEEETIMSRIKLAVKFTAALLRRPVACSFLGFALLFAQPGQAQADPLKFFKNYFVTGDYAVAGVGLDKTGVGGLSSGTIQMGNAAPDEAEAVAAFLYWQVVSSTGSDAGALGATFDGQPLSSPPNVPNPGDGGPLAVVGDANGTASCPLTGGGSGNRLYAYRADVLRFLPLVAGRPRINGDHTVALPDGGGSKSMPRALGASLIVIYRHPNPAEPLKAVVIYDGNFTKQPGQTMSQTIAGFYDPAPVEGKITHVVGSGQWSPVRTLDRAGTRLHQSISVQPGKLLG